MAQVDIVEIIGRAEQGITKPFICRGSDNEIYFVKGRGAGRRSLVCEWVAGCLARKFGLPVAPFTVVDVPQALIELASRDDIAELGSGLAFASVRVQLTELTIANISDVLPDVQIDVLAFDRWIRNGDRTLSSHGGNPNLFWDVQKECLIVLDHNQAFDNEFDVSQFAELHVFSEQCNVLASDCVIQAELEARFERVLLDFENICDTVPEEWWFVDDEQTIPVNFDRGQIKQMLINSCGNAFWSFS